MEVFWNILLLECEARERAGVGSFHGSGMEEKGGCAGAQKERVSCQNRPRRLGNGDCNLGGDQTVLPACYNFQSMVVR